MSTDESSITDVELVSELQKGSQKAFGQLYTRYGNGIYSYCARLLANSPATEDAVHETFMKAFQGIRSLRHPELLKVWLFRIARNEAMMFLRRHRHNGVVDEDTIWDDETPLEKSLSKETVEIVQSALRILKSEYREVIVLREYEQLSYAQIAAVTGDSESSVRSRIFKARKALAERLKPYFR